VSYNIKPIPKVKFPEKKPVGTAGISGGRQMIKGKRKKQGRRGGEGNLRFPRNHNEKKGKERRVSGELTLTGRTYKKKNGMKSFDVGKGKSIRGASSIAHWNTNQTGKKRKKSGAETIRKKNQKGEGLGGRRSRL